MVNFAKPFPGRLLTALLAMNVSACGWVDSTGVQGTTVTVALRNATPVAIIEGTSLTAPLAGEGADLRNWLWELDASDVRSRCSSISGFDETVSATSLTDACSDSSQCSVKMEESEEQDGETVFTLTMPALRSPVALNYRLSAIREDGATIEREQLLCGLSVNEAPLAGNDNYVALLDELLVINASDSNNLLANDNDDDDVRNQALIVTGIVQQPAYASSFSFDDNGGFTYAVSAQAPANTNGRTEDSFVYTVTDGLHEVQASAFITVISGNTAPTVTDISNLTVRNSFDYDISVFFSDADNDDLTFSASSLPDGVSISTQGIISGESDSDNRGTWTLWITANDGNGATVSDSFQLRIR